MGQFDGLKHPRSIDGKFGSKPVGPGGVVRRNQQSLTKRSAGSGVKPSNHQVPKVDSIKRGSRRGG